MEGRIAFTILTAGNPDPRNPPIERGSYISGKIIEAEDYLVLSRLSRPTCPCQLECSRFDLQLEAALCDVIHFRNQGLGRLHFAIAERLSDQFVDYVESHPNSLEMNCLFDANALDCDPVN